MRQASHHDDFLEVTSGVNFSCKIHALHMGPEMMNHFFLVQLVRGQLQPTCVRPFVNSGTVEILKVDWTWQVIRTMRHLLLRQMGCHGKDLTHNMGSLIMVGPLQ